MATGIIAALLEHKFDLSKMESIVDKDQYYNGPVMSIVHKDVNLTFQLSVHAKNPRKYREDHLGLSVSYVDGPTKQLRMSFALFVANSFHGAPVCIGLGREHKFESQSTKSDGGAVRYLPGRLEGLRRQGHLSPRTILHAFAAVFIPESAFEDTENLYPASSAQNRFNQRLYLETDTPSATNWPSNRFELISNDGHHLWVHKEVLAFNSNEFEQMFDPSKPEDARFSYWREGRMTLKNASGGALKEMITYLLLQHTTPDFYQFAMELMPVAGMYGLKGLCLLCGLALLVKGQNEKDIDELLRLHEFAQLHEFRNLNLLQLVSVKRLKEVVKELNDVDIQLLLNVTEQAHKFGYEDLKTVCQQKLAQLVNERQNWSEPMILDLANEANKYELNELTLVCGQWVNKDWKKMSNHGDLSDIFGEIFARLMTLAEQ